MSHATLRGVKNLDTMHALPSQWASDFSEEIHVTAAVDTVAPLTPSSFTLTPIAEGLQLTWINPTLNDDGTLCYDLSDIAIYRSTSASIDITDALTYDKRTLVDGEAYTYPASDTTQTYYFVITAIDTSGNESPASSELSDTSNKPIAPAPVIPDDASGLIFDDTVGGDGVVEGYAMMGIAFQPPPSSVVGLRSIRLWYQYTDDAGTNWRDEDGVADQWTELFPDGYIGFLHKDTLLETNIGTRAYRYAATFIGEDETESSTPDTAGGTGTVCAADNNNVVAISIFASRIVCLGEVTADAITVNNLAAINADLGAATAGSLVVGSANKIWLNEGADGVLAIGGSTKATAPFSVSADGVLTATGAVISGTVTIGAGSSYAGDAIGTAYTAAKCTDANADQTSANTAAAIAGQGSLALLSVVGNAYITDLSFSKLTGATNTASLVIGGAGYIASSNYSAGSAGFKIAGSGAAEFSDVTVRGKLIANTAGSDVPWSYVSGVSIEVGDITVNDDISFYDNGTRHNIFGANGIYYATSASEASPYIKINSGNVVISEGTGGSTITVDGGFTIAGTSSVSISTSGSMTLTPGTGDTEAITGLPKYSGNVVFGPASAPGTTWTDLDMGASGTNDLPEGLRCLCLFVINNDGVDTSFYFRPNGSSAQQGTDASDFPGAFSCKCDNTREENYFWCLTDTTGTMEWYSGLTSTCTITMLAYFVCSS